MERQGRYVPLCPTSTHRSQATAGAPCSRASGAFESALATDEGAALRGERSVRCQKISVVSTKRPCSPFIILRCACLPASESIIRRHGGQGAFHREGNVSHGTGMHAEWCKHGPRIYLCHACRQHLRGGDKQHVGQVMHCTKQLPGKNNGTRICSFKSWTGPWYQLENTHAVTGKSLERLRDSGTGGAGLRGVR